MRAVIQRVRSASVSVDGKSISAINRGLMVLIGVEVGDTAKDCDTLAIKIMNLRIFPSVDLLADSVDGTHANRESPALSKKWDRSVMAIDGEVLCISQFTLLASVKKNKPSFHHAEKPTLANELYELAMNNMRKIYGEDSKDKVKPGAFGEYMQVALINDGPVTIELSSR
ncbi:D-Tyr tRNAtyr deacylase-like domain-containing protein [Lipomyces arxii]|uniref:D-Tyr tRNAtyr deacylase-like domain-containing protein n=1 Tax=Lipomyces arxii TaxID=56418 RepID=UPI0034CFDFE8